ncbi:MAG: YkgJ family cysteine cluster protein [Desulfobacterales bacterium]|nr:MAG: YkgJ family cysteine cluster protein [Desulfobacterales bacterium]
MKNKARQPNKKGLTVLGPEDDFRFACHHRLECFTRCCRDIAIFLTPYDILRLKNALEISSEKFLRNYTATFISEAGLPVVMLKMRRDAAKSCPFVTPRGCTVYSNRPWSCRIYPLQPESTKITEKSDKAYYSIMNVPFCVGSFEDTVSTVTEWLEGQGVRIYREMEKLFKNITMNEFFVGKKIANQSIKEMYYMAAYDLDRFRRFVFESTFLERFETDPDELERMKHDDVALYKFAMKWLEYGLIGHHALHVKPEAMAAPKHELGIK